MAYSDVYHFYPQKQLKFQIVGKSLELNHIYQLEVSHMFLVGTSEKGCNGFQELLSR